MSELTRIMGFMTKEEWLPKGEIFYCIIGGDTEEEHDALCEKYKEQLEKEHDDDYTSWVFTGQVRKKVGAMEYLVTVIGFRIRDSY